jgi:uncharacterized protein (TIGR02246 family)
MRTLERRHRRSATFALVAAVAAITATGCAQSPSRGRSGAEVARAAVRAADSTLQAAVASRDLERIAAFYAEDAALLPTAEPMVLGRAAIRAEWAHVLGIPDFRNTAVVRRIDAAESGDLAYSMGTYVATMQGEDGTRVTEPGKWLSVWRKQADGTWRIVVDTYNTDIPPPDHK